MGKDKSSFKSYSYRTAGLWLVVLLLGCGTFSARADKATGDDSKLSREELQSAVVNYADRFVSIIGQAAFLFEKELPTPEARLISARRKVYTLSAAVTIAAGPEPAAALLDMAVLATLNRMVWEDYWRPQVFGQPAAIIVSAFQKMEDDAFSIAAKVMTPGQLKELRDLIKDWHDQHPDQIAVDFIRFSDFGELGRKPELKKIKAPGGLLAPVKEAAQAADEIRLTSERAMFLFSKLQLIMGLQAELIYKELVMQPEVTGLLKDVNAFKQQMGDLPDRIAHERQAALNDISQLVASERTAVLAAFDQRESKLRAILGDTRSTMERADILLTSLQQTMTSAERVVGQTEEAGKVFQELVGAVDRLAARMASGKSEQPGKPFDINDYIPALEKLNQTVREAALLVGVVDQTGSPLVRQVVAEINLAAEKRVDDLFWRLLILLGITGLIGAGIVVVHHLMKRRDPVR